MSKNKIWIRPQPGPQFLAFSSPADILIYGGGAGGGKTFYLLTEPARHFRNPLFGGVIFRRTSPQIRNEGGLWDQSRMIYPLLGGVPREGTLDWAFPSGARMNFSHMQYESDRFNWQGTEVPFQGWDELTHFSERQFFYMLSRARSMSGVSGYVRASCNPDPDSWVARFIQWWWDPETGYPIPERSGVLRYFARSGDEIVWADSAEELLKRLGPDCGPKSVTFIAASVYDNKILLAKDPAYLSNLKALPLIEREQLLNGNWKIRPAAGMYFKRDWFEVVNAAPADAMSIRYWDRAGTQVSPQNPDPDWTAGVKMSRDAKGVFYIEDISRLRESSLGVERAIVNAASQDGVRCAIGIEQDPGSAGKSEAAQYVRALAGFVVRAYPVSKDKVTRAKPFSAQCEAGNVKLVRGAWNEPFLNEAVAFDGLGKTHDDQIDACSGAFNALASGRLGGPSVTQL